MTILNTGASQLDRRVSPSHLERIVSLGNEYRRQGDLKSAKRNYLMALEIDPHYKKGWLNLGALLAGLELYDDEVDELMMKGDPFGTYKPFLYPDKEPQKITLQELNKALIDQEHSLTDSFFLGERLMSFFQYNLAIDFWANMVMRYPNLVAAWMNLGVIKAKLNHFMEAKFIFLEKILKNNPYFPNIYHNLSIIYREEKNFPLWVKYQLMEVTKQWGNVPLQVQ